MLRASKTYIMVATVLSLLITLSAIFFWVFSNLMVDSDRKLFIPRPPPSSFFLSNVNAKPFMGETSRGMQDKHTTCKNDAPFQYKYKGKHAGTVQDTCFQQTPFIATTQPSLQ